MPDPDNGHIHWNCGMSKRPWEFHPDLSRDRLQLIAEVLRHVRTATIPLHDPGGGDTPWILGCRIYGRSADILHRTGPQLWDWFRVIKPPLEFVFTVGDVPMRFCRDDPDYPDAQHLRVTEVEAEQHELAFGDNSVDLIWRIVVEANPAGEAETVAVIGATRGGDVRCKYVVPELDGSIAFISSPTRPRTGPGVQLPEPVVKPRNTGKKRDDDKGI
jgi:hypothetical protein